MYYHQNLCDYSCARVNPAAEAIYPYTIQLPSPQMVTSNGSYRNAKLKTYSNAVLAEQKFLSTTQKLRQGDELIHRCFIESSP